MVSEEENLFYLKEWKDNILLRVEELKEYALRNSGSLYFSISCVTVYELEHPYLTPMRSLGSDVLSGVVVFSQTQAVIAAYIIKDVVDVVLIDVEKKIGMRVGINEDILKSFNFEQEIVSRTTRSSLEFGNISKAITKIIPKKKLIQFKPNDLTVEGVWGFLSLKLGELSGRKISIIGCGNIGYKLALKLVESGVNVVIVRRDSVKGVMMANSINMIKPPTTLASVEYSASAIQASILCDVIVGTATTNVPVISWGMIQAMKSSGFVLDVGKGNLEIDARRNAAKEGVEVFRGDVTSALFGFVYQNKHMQNLLENDIGRIVIDSNISIISGGIYGREGEIVVDCFSSPKFVYGISNGLGSLKTVLTASDIRNIDVVKKTFSLN